MIHVSLSLADFLKPDTTQTSFITEVEDFLTKSTSFLDSLTWIERYSWFAYSVSSKMPSVDYMTLIGFFQREDNVTHYSKLHTVCRFMAVR